MIKFQALMRGEDRTEFTIEVEAISKFRALDEIDALYPEARVLSLMDETDLIAQAQCRHARMQAIYDDPTMDDYDY